MLSLLSAQEEQGASWRGETVWFAQVQSLKMANNKYFRWPWSCHFWERLKYYIAQQKAAPPLGHMPVRTGRTERLKICYKSEAQSDSPGNSQCLMVRRKEITLTKSSWEFFSSVTWQSQAVKFPCKESQVDQRTLDQGTVHGRPQTLHTGFHLWPYHDFMPSIVSITKKK